MCTHVGMHIGRSRFYSSTVWVLGIEPRSPSLAASPSTSTPYKEGHSQPLQGTILILP